MVENEGLPVTSGKTDRRVKYSKMVIKKSFVQLLKEKNISKITIKELCELADVNRATFYAHYTDQYDLLEQIEQELMSGINQYIISDLFHESTKTPVSMLVKILDFIKDNAELFHLFLNVNNDFQFEQQLIALISEQHFFPFFEQNKTSIEDSEYIFLFLANGCVGVIQRWLKDGTKKSSQEVAELIIQLSLYGNSSFDR